MGNIYLQNLDALNSGREQADFDLHICFKVATIC